MSEQAAGSEKFTPIQISSALIDKVLEKEAALEALKKQSEILHDTFWDEVCETYGLDREQSYTLDKEYLTSGVVMLRKKDDCCGICRGEHGDMPDPIKALLKRVLGGSGSKIEAPKDTAE